ncbi:MAG: dihydroorotase [Candidatus Hodarchaeales archaeon]|jgi:dihydroorotase
MWIYNCQIVTDKEIKSGKLEFSEETGKILQVSHQQTVNSSIKEQGIDAKGLYLCPGMVDVHVHLRDLNQSYKETLESGTQAALHGGITTVFDMPNKDPKVDNLKILNELKEKASKISSIDIFSYLLLNEKSLECLERELDNNTYWKVVFGGTTNVESEPYDIINKFTHKTIHSKFLAIHAEDGSVITKNQEKFSFEIENHNDTRSIEAENLAIEKILSEINIESNINHYHFAHITHKKAIDYIFKQNLPNYSIEATPHHLVLSTNDLNKLKNRGFVNPPLRTKQIQQELKETFLQRKINILGTDHAPHTLEEKIEKKLSGFPSLETVIPVMLTAKIPLPLLVETYSKNPSKIMKLKDRGEIKTGKLADLILIDLKKPLRVSSNLLYSKAKWSPWEGDILNGWVSKTWKRGKLVMDAQI